MRAQGARIERVKPSQAGLGPLTRSTASMTPPLAQKHQELILWGFHYGRESSIGEMGDAG